ncbi:hypothetical protein G9A89_020890 [Geosiphon pyriformis]|nr:hypothetical protein G9A89_020890 [Geosiphon pyriformis]
MKDLKLLYSLLLELIIFTISCANSNSFNVRASLTKVSPYPLVGFQSFSKSISRNDLKELPSVTKLNFVASEREKNDRAFPQELEIRKHVLSMLAQSAYYASRFSFPNPVIDLFSNIKVHFLINQNQEHQTSRKEMIIVVKAVEYKYKYWETRKNLWYRYPGPGNYLIDNFFFEQWSGSAVSKLGKKMVHFLKDTFSSDEKPSGRFIGFGTGGVYAVLAALSFQNLFYEKPVVVTFGQPRMGDEGFATLVNQQLSMYRVTHADDQVPSYPPPYLSYRHLINEFWIPEQKQCSCTTLDFDEIALFPQIFNCNQDERVFENPNCNAKFHPRNILDSLTPHRKRKSDPHFGPYFGYMMIRS